MRRHQERNAFVDKGFHQQKAISVHVGQPAGDRLDSVAGAGYHAAAL